MCSTHAHIFILWKCDTMSDPLNEQEQETKIVPYFHFVSDEWGWKKSRKISHTYTQKIFAQRNPLQHTFFSFRLFHSSATILEVLFASHLGHSSISPTICIQYNTWCSVFIFHVDFFRWNSCRRAKDEQPPEIRPVLKSTRFFLATFFFSVSFSFSVFDAMRWEDNFLYFCKL